MFRKMFGSKKEEVMCKSGYYMMRKLSAGIVKTVKSR
jgi:hypothetical protein